MLVLFFVPETYSPVLLRAKAAKLRKETGEERWYASIEKMERSIPIVCVFFLFHLLDQILLVTDRPSIFVSAFYAPSS